MPTFAENLRCARLANNLSQTALAKKVGASSNMMVSNHERGVTKPTWRQVVQYATALNIKPLDLKGGE